MGFRMESGERSRSVGAAIETAPTLGTGSRQAAVCYSLDADNSNSMKSSNPESGCREVEIARTIDTSTPDPSKNQGGIAVVYDARGNGDGKIAPTMTGDHQNRVTDYTAVVCEGKAQGFPLGFRPENVRVYDEVATTVCNGTRPGFTCGVIADQEAERQHGGTKSNRRDRDVPRGDQNDVRPSIVRRLTPKECERLQSFPDGWTDIGDWTDEKGKKRTTSDAARYKALGNSIALPFWFWLLKRISAHCAEKTMGSLFDGIGGFPLCWQFINGDGASRWSSEIEPFCIAVLKKHFGDEETGQKGDWETYVDRSGNEA